MAEKREDKLKKIRSILDLFITMMKIGMFTFGGGYAMISLLESELVEKRKWLDHEEFLDLVTVAESTPGPIAINCATYIGYKKEKLWGALFATLGMCIPSFTIIFLISLFFDRFLEIGWVSAAFRGIQVCVIYLIFKAGFKMLRKIKKTPFTVGVMSATLACAVTFSLFSVSFSSIFYILIFGLIGILVFTVKYLNEKKLGGGEK